MRLVLAPYGTDLGNRRVAGIDPEEFEGLRRIGMSAAEIVAAATSAPAQVFGLTHLGRLEPGARASLPWIDGDIEAEPARIAAPEIVLVDGRVL